MTLDELPTVERVSAQAFLRNLAPPCPYIPSDHFL
jgi:hypothetical protein